MLFSPRDPQPDARDPYDSYMLTKLVTEGARECEGECGVNGSRTTVTPPELPRDAA